MKKITALAFLSYISFLGYTGLQAFMAAEVAIRSTLAVSVGL